MTFGHCGPSPRKELGIARIKHPGRMAEVGHTELPMSLMKGTTLKGAFHRPVTGLQSLSDYRAQKPWSDRGGGLHVRQ